MILLHNTQSKESREFLVKNRKEFSEVIKYPECVDKYPNISSFPAVVIDIPEYTKDLSLWYNIKKLPNYKRLGMTVKDFQIVNHASQESCGLNSGVVYMNEYITNHNLPDDYKQFLVDLANDLSIPACFAWYGVQAKWVYDLGEECVNDIHEFNKTRCISYNSNEKILEIIPPSIKIIYPTTIQDVYDEIAIYTNKIEERNAIYQGN